MSAFVVTSLREKY